MVAVYILVCMSAVMYALAFIYSHWLWWLVFVYAIPLFYAACVYRLTACQGFVWGLIFFGLQCVGLVSSLYQMANGPWYMCIAPGILFILYMALYPMLLFGLLNYLVRFVVRSHVTMLILWVSGWCVMMNIIERYAFIPLGTHQGFGLMNSLILLASHPSLLRVAQYTGVTMMTGILLTVAATVTVCMLYRSWVSVWCVLLVMLPWILMWCVPISRSSVPSWVSRIAVLPTLYPADCDGPAAAQSLLDDVRTTVCLNPSVDIIIMPESALPGSLTQQLSHHMWPHACASVQLIAGSNYCINTCYSNCALWIAASGQRGCFAKRRLVPPIEYMPCWCCGLESLYGTTCQTFVPSDNERPCFKLDDMFTCVPYICSELFLSVMPDEAYTQLPILLLVNDVWCKADYLVRCLYLCARFKAIVWQRDIVYASYYHAAWLSKTGEIVQLVRA